MVAQPLLLLQKQLGNQQPKADCSHLQVCREAQAAVEHPLTAKLQFAARLTAAPAEGASPD